MMVLLCVAPSGGFIAEIIFPCLLFSLWFTNSCCLSVTYRIFLKFLYLCFEVHIDHTVSCSIIKIFRFNGNLFDHNFYLLHEINFAFLMLFLSILYFSVFFLFISALSCTFCAGFLISIIAF